MAVIRRARVDHFTRLNQLRNSKKTSKKARAFYNRQRAKGLGRIEAAAKTAGYFGG